MIRSSRSALPGLLVLALLAAGCGGGDPAPTSAASSPSSSSPATTVDDADGSPGTDGADAGTDDDEGAAFPANTEPDTGAASADALVSVTDIRVGRQDGFDRVVFQTGGTGTPGWDVRYVESASRQGSGDPVEVAGDAVLQVTVTGAGYPFDTGVEEWSRREPVRGDTDSVTEVVWDGTFEGRSVAFVGVTEQLPFRVYLLEEPARVVVEVGHAG